MDHGAMVTGTATGAAAAATSTAPDMGGMGGMGDGCKISVRHGLPDPNSIMS
jgi:hypothetical protein